MPNPLGWRILGAVLILDRQWQGVRIARSSGTTHPETFAELNRALTRLKRADEIAWSVRLAIWGELAGGTLHPQTFLETIRRDGLRGLRPAAHAQPLAHAVTRWLLSPPATRSGVPLAATTVRGYRLALTQHVLNRYPNAHVDDLPALVRAVRETRPPGTAGVVRTAALAFARWFAGRHSDLWRQLADVAPPLKQPTERKGLPVEEAKRILDALGKDGLMWWTLCTTGMRVKREYIQRHYEVHDTHLEVTASKTRAGRRTIPVTHPVWPAHLSYSYFAERLSHLGTTAHVARYTYRHALEEVGIPPSRLAHYMGHSLPGMAIYGRHDVRPHLETDAAKLRAYFGPAPRLLRAAG